MRFVGRACQLYRGSLGLALCRTWLAPLAGPHGGRQIHSGQIRPCRDTRTAAAAAAAEAAGPVPDDLRLHVPCPPTYGWRPRIPLAMCGCRRGERCGEVGWGCYATNPYGAASNGRKDGHARPRLAYAVIGYHSAYGTVAGYCRHASVTVHTGCRHASV